MQRHVLSMHEPKIRLRNLWQYYPRTTPEMAAFARSLAQALNPELAPEGFVRTAQLVLYNLQHGTDARSPALYQELESRLGDIAAAVFPPVFAAEVKEFLDRTEHMVRTWPR